MKKISDFIDKYQNLIIIVIAILSVYLISVFPPSGDDFNRLHEGFVGISDGIQRVKRLYTTLNGRVLGNEISYIFIGRLARTIIKTITVILYIILMMKVLNIKRLSGLIIIVGSIILMPLAVFRQVLVWSAGFYNYFPPLILILFLIYIFIYHRGDFSKAQLIAIFLISLAGALFLENLTIYLLFLPLLLALCFWNKDNKVAYITSLAGSLIGALIMFMSPIYRKVFNDQDGYRSVADDVLAFVAENWEVFSEYMLVFNIFILVLFFGAFLLGSYKARLEGRKSFQPLAIINLIAIIIFTAFDLGSVGQLISLFLHISFYILLILIAVKEYGFNNFSSRMILFSSLSMAIAMGPLLVVSPINARNFLTPIIFNVLIIISLLRLVKVPEKIERNFNRIVPLIMLIVFAIYLFVYTVNYSTFKERDRILNEAIAEDKDEAYIPSYPFDDFNGGYGTDSMGNYYYKEEQKDLKINIVD